MEWDAIGMEWDGIGMGAAGRLGGVPRPRLPKFEGGGTLREVGQQQPRGHRRARPGSGDAAGAHSTVPAPRRAGAPRELPGHPQERGRVGGRRPERVRAPRDPAGTKVARMLSPPALGRSPQPRMALGSGALGEHTLAKGLSRKSHSKPGCASHLGSSRAWMLPFAVNIFG